jgi:hypothetical protein
MAQKMNISCRKLFPLMRYTVCLSALVLFSPTAHAQSVQVNGGTGDAASIGSWITDKLEYAWTKAMDYQKLGQADWNRAIDSIGKSLQTQIATLNTNTLSQNMYGSAHTAVHVKTGVDAYIPTNSTSCGNNARGQGAAMSKASGAAEAKALTMANSNRPDDPATSAKFINLRCKFHFAPNTSNTQDPEASAYKALAGSCDGTHAHADEVLDALLAPLQYNVDPNLTLVNHVFTPPDTPPADGQSYPNDYYPFYEALFYCLNVNPPQPRPPSTTSTQANLTLLNIGPYVNSDASNSVGPSSCFRALEKRMQYGANINPATFPAFHKGGPYNVQSRHDEQVVRCTANYEAHIIDAATYTDCLDNGRSDLQSDFDQAFRDGAPDNEWETQVLSQMESNDAREAERTKAQDAELAFEARLEAERMGVVEAIQASNSVGHSISHVSSSVSQPVSQ